MQPRDVIRSIAGPTGDLGAAYYFHPDTLARGKELGLDGMRFYVLGRGGVLGDVEPYVVLAAFGYFEPGLVAKLWNTGKERVSPRDAARAHLECNAALGRSVLADVDPDVLRAYGDAAAALVAAVDPSGLSLFAGIRAEPVPEDAPARALHHAVLLRELRGSAHLVAVRAVGLDSVVAHAIKRPSDVPLFGWSESPEVTDRHRELLAQAEDITDTVLEQAFSALDAVQCEALVTGTEAMATALAG